ncbi:hypothetical protein Scep_010843 [Stephania cephalantha]|uniref:DUF4005 domain-containing protein n=1 Tax=Stephania cephalantha TaxID=152367 RepID=A0AAP0JVY1_9MAGN
MGKKGSWFSAIKKAFAPNSKDKLGNDQVSEDKRGTKKKKWGLAKLRHGESNFIPLYREPSSIEKILGDAEREQQKAYQPLDSDPYRSFSMPATVNRQKEIVAPSMPHSSFNQQSEVVRNVNQQRDVVRNVQQLREVIRSPRPPLRNHHDAAVKIQTYYRGYMARRSFRALKGLVRLQGVIRGQSVKRQTMNAMKYMQLLVRVQSQIHSRRIQMLENQSQQRHNLYKNDKELDSSLSKWTLTPSELGLEEWDDSVLTKEEIDTRQQRKVNGIVRRERATAYANSHQWLKAPVMEVRSGGFPWWWTWIERQLPQNSSDSRGTPSKNNLTPPHRRTPEAGSRPPMSPHKQTRIGFDNLDALTPRSSKSSVATTANTRHVPVFSNRTPPAKSPTALKPGKPKIRGSEFAFDVPMRDDESLTSCPAFSVPSYMAPTVSAKAKARAQSNPRERQGSTPPPEQRRRLSFPLGQSIGSIKWNKSFFSSKDSTSQRLQVKDTKSLHSIGNLSVDSTTSLPAAMGRRPFNRFV